MGSDLYIYQFEPAVLASNKDLFDTPIDNLLTLPPDEIDKWITSRRPIILQSRRKARRHSTCNVQLLPSYFHPLRQSKPNPDCQYSDYIVYASNPNKPNPPTSSCTSINEIPPTRPSSIRIQRLSALSNPDHDSIHSPTNIHRASLPVVRLWRGRDS
jgi:hypothetical protein